ncbi:PKD domain-containing protein [bacterium]|nr:PKD domain-containing protein [bacterium]
MNFKVKIIFIILLFLAPFAGFAQLSANFTASKTQGCDVLGNVVFTDLSTGNPTSWKWDFGNGNFSFLQNPTVNFSSVGNYNITLTVSNSNGNNSTTKLAYIKVFKSPESKLTASPLAGCGPLTVNFQDNSINGSGTINQWLWDFNDGSPAGNNQNPSHTYQTVGSYNVSLKVTDNNGCSNTKTNNNYITVTSAPVARFNASTPIAACSAPHTVNFVNTSTGNGLTYQWDFGNGMTSTLANPSTTYNSFGVYTVSLTVRDASGCSDTRTQNGYVTIQPINADFSIDFDSICQGLPISFTNNSVGSNFFLWDFGDGNSIVSNAPTHTYSHYGTYRVKLTARFGSNCIDTLSRLIYIDSIDANFDIDPLFNCQFGGKVHFYNRSFNADSITWIIDNLKKIKLDTLSLSNYTDGFFSDTLIATNKFGCIDTLVRTDRNSIITGLKLEVDPVTGGCIPQEFVIKSFPITSTSIISYRWEVGDNGAQGIFTSRDSLVYSLNQDTTLTVFLTVTDSSGCTATDSIEIMAGYPGHYSLLGFTDTVCASDTLFAHFSFPEKEMSVFKVTDMTNNKNLSFIYKDSILKVFNFTDTGKLDLKLVIDYFGCKVDSALSVQINGPIIKNLTDSADCTDLLTHYFKSEIIDYHRFYWNFGDNSPIDSINLSPIHTYSVQGYYDVTLTAFNDSTGCSFERVMKVSSNPYQTFILANNAIKCAPFNYTLKPILPDSVLDFHWLIGGVVFTQDSIMGSFSIPGTRRVQLVSTNNLGCVDTASIDLIAYEIVPTFSATPTRFCDPSTVIFTDTTNGFQQLVEWTWDFGNGKTSKAKKDSTLYALEGGYTVSLSIRDTLGCIGTTTKNNFIRFLRNTPRFLASNRRACVGELVQFSNISTGDSLTYLWDFGNGKTSTDRNGRVVYDSAGVYDISLTTTNPINCSETLSIPNYIFVEAKPTADFSADTTYSNCYPLPVNFINTSPDSNIVKWYWDFGDNSSGSLFKDAFHNYTTVGNFDVTHAVETNSGCKDTIIKTEYIQTRGPSAEIRFYPDSICINEEITFEVINPKSVASYIWDFADGKSATTSPVTHRYTDRAGTLYPTLILNDSAGLCSIGIRDTIYIKEMIALIGISDSSGCEPLTVNLKNETIGDDNSYWDFGNGETSTQDNITKTYYAGIYPIHLYARGLGCIDTTLINLEVFPKPVLTVTKDSSICEGDSIQLFGSGGESYLWEPSSGLSNPTISSPMASPDFTTNYRLTVTDTNSCSDTRNVQLTIYNQPKIQLFDDTLIYLGEDLKLIERNNNANVIYSWTPSTGLSCTDCPNPKAKPLVTTKYILRTTDLIGCFEFTDSITVEVHDGFTTDIPKAFSPNGDGVNDIIYVRGWGIKELLIFEIYNRWGEKIFETNDQTIGWDGTYKGQPQAIDTYIFVVKALGYNDNVIEKKGNITLLR